MQLVDGYRLAIAQPTGDRHRFAEPVPWSQYPGAESKTWSFRDPNERVRGTGQMVVFPSLTGDQEVMVAQSA